MAAGRRRLVVHVRDILPASAAGRLVRRLMRTVAGDLVFISHAVAEEFGGGRGRARRHVVHNAVDLAAFDPAGVDREQSRRALGLAHGTIALGTLAQITPWKGQDDAIRVLAGLRSRGHDAVLLLAGEAKFTSRGTRHDNEAYLRSLVELTAALGVRDSVRFLGERKDVPALLAALDIVLVPSLEEPFGRVVVEAMAMARPVVSANVGGPPEIIEDGRTGLLLPPRAPQAWVQAIGSLVGDADAAAAMGRAARTDAVRRFGPEDHAAAMLAVYRRVIGTG
jgi:glycosyltransferase involved in cell wall biosynthesis